jgi:hypothetical protein
MSATMSAAEQKRQGAKLQAYIDQMPEFNCLFELRGHAAEAGGYLQAAVEYGGLPELVAEAWAARIKKALQAGQRRLNPRSPKRVMDSDVEQVWAEVGHGDD